MSSSARTFKGPDSRGPLAIAVGGLIAMASAVGVGRFVYTPILPSMSAALGISKSGAGFIASANFLGYLVGALLAATPFVPGSRRTWLVIALAVSAVTTGAMGVAFTVTAFMILRFVGGVASAFGLVFSSALVLDRLARAQRAELSAVHFGGVGTGIALSAILVAALGAREVDWRTLWLASGALALLGCIAVATLVPDAAEPPRPATTVPRRTGRLTSVAVAYGLFGFGYVITATFLVAIVRESARVRPFEPAVWVVVGVAAIPSVAVWTWAGRRIGHARAFAAASMLEAAGVVASVLWVAPAGILLAATLLGGTFMGLTALGLIQGRELAASDPRRTLAIMTAAFGLGQMLGPACAGVLFDVTGTFVTASLGAAAALVVSALLSVAPLRTAA
ncbi:MAG TPA: YbfB/YjiJ family MFS transporter [Methylomirabilota bacterium]|jgi:predicted MFS family arabinose efflux permease|nr:YbfB/YjiJ family MFS transporter [Methylomirabilota bacterium]